MKTKKTLLVVFGTRPEAIKLAPVCQFVRENPNFELLICNTGQQRDMAEKTLSFFALKSDYNLDVMQEAQTLFVLQARLLEKLSSLLTGQPVDGIIVQGDTMSAFCGALAGFYGRIPVFHVEAGLRSESLGEPFPEEGLRQMLSRITTLHFAPSAESEKNLLRENIASDRIFITGNTVIDALYSLAPDQDVNAASELEKAGMQPDVDKVLVTVHRRENHGTRLENIIKALQQIAQKYPQHQFILPVHPNPAVKERIQSELAACGNILLLPPLDYPQLCYLMKESVLILTDSGGIQEEAPTFGTPLVVLREKTERMEGVEKGCAFLAGADTEMICHLAEKFLSSPSKKRKKENPYGDGKAAEKIVAKLVDFYSAELK